MNAKQNIESVQFFGPHRAVIGWYTIREKLTAITLDRYSNIVSANLEGTRASIFALIPERLIRIRASCRRVAYIRFDYEHRSI